MTMKKLKVSYKQYTSSRQKDTPVRSVKNGGVTTPKGFLANGMHCGIKSSGKHDLGLLYSVVPATVSGAFTENALCAAPVTVTKERLRHGFTRAIIVNSGNANCADGKKGIRSAQEMADRTGKRLGVEEGSVLVASTGVIGKPLPIGNIRDAIPQLVSGLHGKKRRAFARAILTTDTTRKESCVKVKLKKARGTIGGVCKGAGMICPSLRVRPHATMLAFITTDISISKRLLDKALSEAVDRSFNVISVDNDMSTNDTVLVLANGLAGNSKIIEEGSDFQTFKKALCQVTRELAKKIVLDGEGATKFVEIRVRGAQTYAAAKQAVRSVATSTLFKASLYGEDPNWGRVYSACGASGIEYEPGKVDIYFGKTKVVSEGMRAKAINPRKLRSLFKKAKMSIIIDLHSGIFEAVGWTCDLSKEYIDINAAYET